MKSLLMIAITAIFLNINSVFSQSNETSKMNNYDSLYAEKLGADDYGMRKYVMAFLKSGTVNLNDKTKEQELQIGHMKNIVRMAEEGKLILAGPFMDNQPIRGIYIFNVETIEEAKELTSTDPAIQAGVLEMELHPWYGSAALMEVNSLHKKVQKKSFTDE